jgi:membrane associated rhomboid family serine protease
MRQSEVTRIALPTPGPVLWSVLALTAVLGMVTAGSRTAADALFSVLACDLGHALREPWRLLSSDLLAGPPGRWSTLLFSVLGLYFLGSPLEHRWGSRRFLKFIVYAACVGNVAAILVDHLVGFGDELRFHPGLVYGPAAVVAGLSVAWGREFAHQTVRFFFVLPMRAHTFVWITLGLCVVNFVFPDGIPEGAIAPFGGVFCGYWLSGNPSIARSFWLRVRLAWIRRRFLGNSPTSRRPPSQRRGSGTSPPLTLLPGGLEDLFENRTPPKDKRDLN